MGKRLGIGLCVAMMLTPTDASALVTVEHIESTCRGVTADNFTKSANHYACVNYVAGFMDGYNSVAWALPHQIFCTPDGANAMQLARVFLLWAEKNPAKGHEPASTGFISALTEAYPCPSE